MAKKLWTKKLSTNAKKIIVLSTMMVLLVATGVLNFVFNDNLNPNNGNVDVNLQDDAVATFFNSCRSTRETTRAEELLILDSILASTTSSDEMKLTADQKKMDIIQNMENELIIENVLKSKGFSDVLVKMSERNCDIIIEPLNPTDEQLAQIFSVIVNQTNYKTSQIFIFPVEV